MSVGPMTILGALWSARTKPTVRKRQQALAAQANLQSSSISPQQAYQSMANICSAFRIPKVEATGFLNHEYAQDADNVLKYIDQTTNLYAQASLRSKLALQSHVLGTGAEVDRNGYEYKVGYEDGLHHIPQRYSSEAYNTGYYDGLYAWGT